MIFGEVATLGGFMRNGKERKESGGCLEIGTHSPLETVDFPFVWAEGLFLGEQGGRQRVL